MPRLAFAVVYLAFVVGASACNHYVQNLESCDRPENAGRGICPDARTSGGSCQRDEDCQSNAGFPYCNIAGGGGQCVKCTDNQQRNACPTDSPACVNATCQKCT